eukprot:Gb_30221 [translate_table: standard]
MAEMQRQPPHAVVVPLPAQGSFADRNFCPSKGYVEVSTAMQHPQPGLSGFRYLCIPNGLPSDHVSATNALKFMQAVHKLGPAIIQFPRSVADEEAPPITCIVSDCFFAATHEVAKTLGVPRVVLWTFCCNYCNRHSQLSAPPFQGIHSLKEAKRPEKLITCLPGNIPPLWPTDLLNSFRIQDTADASFQIALYEAEMQSKADYVLVNSFEELESPETISGLSQGYPALAVGPVFLPESLMGNGAAAPIVARAWKEDSECLKWLDTHPPGSVLHVSFGSIVVMLNLQLQELAFGLKATTFLVGSQAGEEGSVPSFCGRFSKKIWKIGMDFDSRSEDENVLVTRDEVEKVVRAVMFEEQCSETQGGSDAGRKTCEKPNAFNIV